jgi:hypothetical protein
MIFWLTYNDDASMIGASTLSSQSKKSKNQPPREQGDGTYGFFEKSKPLQD